MWRDYYNEVDPYAAQWLRNLIDKGVLPAGDVDERDIRDVRPADLDSYRRCHFFAGVGVWAAALEAAGWDKTQRVWTGSCPCQPFSSAGQGAGFDDERHLWPDWHWLIEQCRPEIVLGEQVASADGLVWADLVSADLEATGYALGPVDTCAAGFRSFTIRQRLYFAGVDLVSAADARAARDAAIRAFGGLVDAASEGSQGREHMPRPAARDKPAGGGATLGLGDAIKPGLEGYGGHGADRDQPGRHDAGPDGPVAAAGATDRLADTDGGDAGAERQQHGGEQRLQPEGGRRADRLEHTDDLGRGAGQRHDPTAGHGLPAAAAGGPERLADAGCRGIQCEQQRGDDTGSEGQTEGEARQQQRRGADYRLGLATERLADAAPIGRGEERPHDGRSAAGDRAQGSAAGHDTGRADVWADPADGYWRDADWLLCRDGVWRPVEPGTFPLAHAAASRMGRLRAYGNALDLAQAVGFCRAVMERDMGGGFAADLFEWGS